VFTGIVFALKNKFEKKPILLERAEPEGPTRSGPLGPPAKPIGARPHAADSSHPSLVNCDQIQQFATVELTIMTKFVYRHRKDNLL
jgi:hypothetical protein